GVRAGTVRATVMRFDGLKRSDSFAATSGEESAVCRVTQVLPLRAAVEIQPQGWLDRDAHIAPQSLVGRVIHFRNDHHRTAHTIAAVQWDGDDLVLTL